MGNAGTRKSTAIKPAASLIKKAGYTRIAAARTTKEKFLLDLAGDSGTDDAEGEDILEKNLFGDDKISEPAEILVAADEFNVFIGNGNIDFLSLLGVLWDHVGEFEDRKKNSKSFVIDDPVVSILAGNTPTGFSLAFPAEAIGQGIFSRLILVHGETTGRKITWPRPPDEKDTLRMVSLLHHIRKISCGKASFSPHAADACDTIYKSFKGVGDVRFESYANRRFIHFLKLCMIHAAASYRSELQLEDVILSNTVLTHAEHTMPKALGEFGKAKNSDIVNKIVSFLESQTGVVTRKQIWQQVHNDLDSPKQMYELLENLIAADKIVSTKGGFSPVRRIRVETSCESEYLDFSLLTEEERSYLT